MFRNNRPRISSSFSSYHLGSSSPPAAPLSTAASVAAIHGSCEELLAEEEGADAAAVGAAAADAAAAAALARTIGVAAPFRLKRRGFDGGTTDRERVPVRDSAREFWKMAVRLEDEGKGREARAEHSSAISSHRRNEKPRRIPSNESRTHQRLVLLSPRRQGQQQKQRQSAHEQRSERCRGRKRTSTKNR